MTTMLQNFSTLACVCQKGSIINYIPNMAIRCKKNSI